MAGVSRQPPGCRLGVGVLACTCTGLLADAGVLAACFGLAGQPVPWRGLLFAYAAGQLAGRLVPLPGGLGGVEGGVLGVLTLTGTPAAAAAAAQSSPTGSPDTGPSVPPEPRWQPVSPAAARPAHCTPTHGTVVPVPPPRKIPPPSPPSSDAFSAPRS